MSKDMVYNALIESMTEDRCPVCALIDKRIRQAMDGFLYGSVNDTSIRKQLSDAGGLCNYHAAMLESMGDPLAHALIYSDLMKLIVKDMDSPFPMTLEKLTDRNDCYFCCHAEDMEKIYCRAFVQYYGHDEFKQAYSDGGMLCSVHLKIIAESKKHESEADSIDGIMADTKEKYLRLLEQLEEIKRKNDYRFAAEPWTDGAKDAWRRAVSVINDMTGTRR